MPAQVYLYNLKKATTNLLRPQRPRLGKQFHPAIQLGLDMIAFHYLGFAFVHFERILKK